MYFYKYYVRCNNFELRQVPSLKRSLKPDIFHQLKRMVTLPDPTSPVRFGLPHLLRWSCCDGGIRSRVRYGADGVDHARRAALLPRLNGQGTWRNPIHLCKSKIFFQSPKIFQFGDEIILSKEQFFGADEDSFWYLAKMGDRAGKYVDQLVL